jgi:hypothetical protein
VAETCTAIAKKTGQRCKAQPVAGCTVCRLHGGSAPQVRRAGLRRLQRQDLQRSVAEVLDLVGELAERNPADVLLDALREADQMRRMYAQLVGFLGVDFDPDRLDERGRMIAAVWGVDHLGDQARHVLTDLHGEWADRSAKLAKDALALDLEARRIALAQAEVTKLFRAIEDAATAAGVDYEQWSAFRAGLATRLRALDAAITEDGDEPPLGDAADG